MNESQTMNGFAVLCDEYGGVLEVLHNNTKLDGLVVGAKLSQVIGSGSQFKLLEFLSNVRFNGILFDQEFNVVQRDQPILIRISGVMRSSKFMIIGQIVPPDTLDLYRELMLINNEQTDAIRKALKDQTLAAQPVQPDVKLFEEISRMNNELVGLQRELAKKNNELERLYTEVQTLSITDQLTGQLNRRGFKFKAEQEWEHALRYQRPIAVIMFDIDHFKKVNDTYGHAIGDVVLKEVAQRVYILLRNVDIFSRYGGEEFCLLLPETNAEQAEMVAEKIRLSINQAIDIGTDQLYPTVSLGVAENKNNLPNLEQLLENADKTLYQAKNSGRNCTCVFQS